ncbi:uncharacterized protein LOC116179985 [Photinus pyralis]|uniref:uncharacterized protein LOC116179985 n=1 Tax=Photinus pyralis TaxID=7054 RepID=UPI0012674750|nr:uncharacterized protein LOC116179985 [Photinus pyralis]
MIFKTLLMATCALSTILAFDSKKSTEDIFAEWWRRSDEDHPECFESSGVLQEEVENYFVHFQMSSRRNFKCYLECIFKGFKFVNKDGTLNQTEFVQYAAKVSNEMFDACNSKVAKETDGCEMVYQFAYCIVHYAHIQGVLIGFPVFIYCGVIYFLFFPGIVLHSVVELRDMKNLRDPRDIKDPKDLKEPSDLKVATDLKESCDLKDSRHLKDAMDLKDL